MTARRRNIAIACVVLVASLAALRFLPEPPHTKRHERVVNARGMPLRVVMFTPDPAPARGPAVVLAQPVNTPTEYGDALTMELLAEGYRVLSFDWRGWEPGENRQFARAGSPEVLLLDMTAAIQYLRTLPEVNGDRIALTGHSAGGTLAIQAGTLDPRIKAVAPIGMEADVTPNSPRNLLWALGLYDEFRTPLRMLDYFHRSADTEAGINVTVGDFAAGTARRLGVSPTADHFTELRDRTIHREIVNWFNLATGKPTADRMFSMQLRQWPTLLGWWAGLLLAIWTSLELLRLASATWPARAVPVIALVAIWALALVWNWDPISRKNAMQLLVIATPVVGFLHRRARELPQTNPRAGRGGQILRTAALVWLSLLLTLVVNNVGSYFLKPAFLLWVPVFAVQHLLDMVYTYTLIYPHSLLFAPAAEGAVMPRLWISFLLVAEVVSPGILLASVGRLFRRGKRPSVSKSGRRSVVAAGVLVGLLATLGVVVILRLQQGFLTADSAWAAGRFLLRFAVLPIVVFRALRLLARRRRAAEGIRDPGEGSGAG